jgi:gliding motility associated protien GldN
MKTIAMLVAIAGVSLAKLEAQGTASAVNESGAPIQEMTTPLDGIYSREAVPQRRILAYDHVREADVMWEKRIWRVVDLREKMNHHFAYPVHPFFQVIKDLATSGKLNLYNDEAFTQPLTPRECEQVWGGGMDTIEVVDVETGLPSLKYVPKGFDISKITRFRIKEVWFFDKEVSRMQVRILGIAPLLSRYDDEGNFMFEVPMFWVYYPNARQLLANQGAFLGYNDAAQLSWEDIFEMRFFSSYIYKQSNVKDWRLQDAYAGTRAIVESEKITQEIFNIEQDFWSH